MDVNYIVGSTRYSLTSGEYCFLEAWEGTGITDLTRLASRGPQQAGDTDQGERKGARFISLVLGLPGEDESDFDTRRAVLLGILRSKRVNESLEFVLANGVTRTIPVKYFNGLQSYDRAGRRFGRFSAIFKASSPDFLGDSHVVTFGQSGGSGGGFSVPTPVPTPIGGSTLSETYNVNYLGSAVCFPFVRITGPIDDPMLENLTTGETLDFTGLTIGAGEYIEIDLRYAYKRVLDQDGVQVFPSSDSDMATFHFDPAPEAAGGVNVLKITGTNVNGDTRVDCSWDDLHEYL